MPSTPLAPDVLYPGPAFPDGPSGLRTAKALAQRPPLDEGTETGPPAAAADRAELVFETTGIVLILLIVLAAVWILIRKRL
jgi:hypothetical protein